MIKNRIFLVSISLLLVLNTMMGQLTIDTANSVEQMVESVLFANNKNFVVENIRYKGDKKSIGVFHCPLVYNKLLSDGIILSTGNVFDAIGPNTSPDKGSKTLINSDNNLSALAKGYTYDAAILEFDFTSVYDSICFKFFFASEEYPEFVNKNVNDVFGFFLYNKELDVRKNLALLGPAKLPITVDNVNADKCSKYFIRNYSWDPENIQKWENNKRGAELSRSFQFDGLTVVLNAGSAVVPNKKYHIKLAIADVGDRLFDSAIFLEAGSFKSVSAKSVSFEYLVKEAFAGKAITGSNNSIAVNLNINFETDAYKISGAVSFNLLDKVVRLLEKDPAMHLKINGYTDDRGTKEHNKTLSLNRAKAVTGYLIAKGIAAERITYEGFGDSKPLSATDKMLNRRVEFVFVNE